MMENKTIPSLHFIRNLLGRIGQSIFLIIAFTVLPYVQYNCSCQFIYKVLGIANALLSFDTTLTA
jgi:predicted ATPase